MMGSMEKGETLNLAQHGTCYHKLAFNLYLTAMGTHCAVKMQVGGLYRLGL